MSNQTPEEPKKPKVPHIQRYIITGVLTAIPIVVTVFVFQFLLAMLSQTGRPIVDFISNSFKTNFPEFYNSIWITSLDPWLVTTFTSFFAIMMTLGALYLLGWATSNFIGKALLNAVDLIMHRIPVIEMVYGAMKKLVSSLQQQPGDVQRVVLVEFPTKDMKVVGFVTRTLTDKVTGQKLAAVYVPTTPNPTSGYLEIVPLEYVTETDWSMDEAMTFIISGGAVAPEQIPYSQGIHAAVKN
ncbi:DUF502 domain-containing protein [Candidatus Albibeggiatoa sp. nov. NOAA]|uniref:DUF502 domain-containing protein n=1 Tax=Candidatus Albibeggiatoa sp. nov. NOAA TaxID=3162724 RepID=UPI0032F1943A|nr:DUF502 domain-containing protein [Thiotrichaceae bacterium]